MRGKDRHFVIRTILSILPNATIVVFGSRIRGNAKKYSDLDVAVFQAQPIELQTLSQVSEVFSESDLLYKVDLLDGKSIEPGFLDIIRKTGVVWHGSPEALVRTARTKKQ